MHRLSTVSLAISLLFAAACGGSAASPTSPSQPPPVADNPDSPADDPAPTPATGPAAYPTGGAIAFEDALIKLPAIDTLPTLAALPTPGYPGRGFHMGVFTDPASWARFSAAADIAGFEDIDWREQMVVYVVLDAQTNLLGFDTFDIADDGTATLNIDWIGIEPFYPDSTPAVLTLVDRDGIDAIAVTSDGRTLGTIDDF
jgi:hypothetical protein